MIIYIVMIVISLCFLLVAERTERKTVRNTLYVLAVIPFFLVSAFRFDLGTDYTKRYVHDYNVLYHGGNIKNLEIGFKTLVFLCTKITSNPEIIFFITSGITIGLIMITIFTKSKKITFSVLLFFLGGIFFNSLNLVRQYIAIALVFWSYTFICKEKNDILEYAIFILINILAFTFHSSSVVALVLVLLDKKMFTNWKWIIPLCIIIILLNRRLMNLVIFVIQNTRFSTYISGKTSGADLSVLQLIFNGIIYFFMSLIYYYKKKNNKVEREMIFYTNVQAITLVMIALSSVHVQFSRIALYFSIFQVMSIPYFIYNMPTKEILEDFEKKFKNKIHFTKIIPKFELVVSVVFITLFVGLFGYTNIKNNDNDVVPYKTIINRELKIK